MKSQELERYRTTLEGMLAGAGIPLRRRDEIAIENTADTIDQIGNAANRELAVSQLELVSKRQHELRGALQRVKNGSYGICLECESDISAKRLNAIPWAQFCIYCQELLDHNTARAEIGSMPTMSFAQR